MVNHAKSDELKARITREAKVLRRKAKGMWKWRMKLMKMKTKRWETAMAEIVTNVSIRSV